VKAKIAQLQPTMPEGMRLTINFDGTVQIEENVHELEMTLILAVLFTGIVCWLFLGSISSTINVVLAIPTAHWVVPLSSCIFSDSHSTQSHLLGLSMVVGIVVDDAIVVLENIVRHFEKNKSKVLASIIGSQRNHIFRHRDLSRRDCHFSSGRVYEGNYRKVFLSIRYHRISGSSLFSLLEALNANAIAFKSDALRWDMNRG
jgi:hypothetical protein